MTSLPPKELDINGNFNLPPPKKEEKRKRESEYKSSRQRKLEKVFYLLIHVTK